MRPDRVRLELEELGSLVAGLLTDLGVFYENVQYHAPEVR